MQKRLSKSKDLNVIAASVVAQQPEPHSIKNPAAVALGKLGGLKGGKARAETLSAQQRSEIARNAAKARWSKQKSG